MSSYNKFNHVYIKVCYLYTYRFSIPIKNFTSIKSNTHLEEPNSTVNFRKKN